MKLDATAHENVRTSVIQVFNQVRQANCGFYEEDRFLAYLTDPPAPKGKNVTDTFNGRRRYVKFMESIQFELGICFTNNDWEKGVSLEQFVKLIESRLASPKNCRRLAQRRLAEARDCLKQDPIKFGILASPLLTGFISPLAYVGYSCLTIWLAIVCTIVLVNFQECKRARQLVQRISPKAGAEEAAEVFPQP